MMMSWCVFADEGVYVNSTGGPIKDTRLQWGEIPSSIGKCLAIVLHLNRVCECFTVVFVSSFDR